MIRNIVRSLLLVFAAGAAGGLANALAVAGAGESGLLAFLKSDIAQDLTRQMIYMRMVWGGIWGAAFLLPDILRVWPVRNGILNGILLGLLPSAVVLFYLMPAGPAGFMGLEKGLAVPFLVVAFNAVWGVTGMILYRFARS